jgi:ribosome biogenesis GTPase
MAEAESGVVIATQGKRFLVQSESGAIVPCEPLSKVKRARQNETPVAVGDDVRIRVADGLGGIEEVLPRRSSFARPTTGLGQIKQVIAANLDQLVIVASVVQPILKSGLIDRLLIAAESGSLTPIVLVNKADLGIDLIDSEIIEIYRQIGYTVLTVSADKGEGIDSLLTHLVGHRSIFVGHSGVGKSSLLNALIPETGLRIGAVSSETRKGKHTTTTIVMVPIPSGGFLVDSPGVRQMGLWEIDSDDVKEYYPEFRELAHLCRFSGCQHAAEPDCAVKAAVEGGSIAPFRYRNYLAIRDSIDE